jgi:hypothetical protein
MSLLRTALEKQRWDLAAHTIVLAAIRVLNQGGEAGWKKKQSGKGAGRRVIATR